MAGLNDSLAMPSYCGHCGTMHTGTCHRIKAIEYHENGTIKRVEYHAPLPFGVPTGAAPQGPSGQCTIMMPPK